MEGRDKGDGPQRFWAEFAHDPRRPENAPLRASDADREVVSRALGEAYADGRLDRDELDERTTGAQAARTLGELPALVADLVAPDEAPRPPGLLGPEELRARAERHYESQRREAFLGMLGPSLICVMVWALTGHDVFFWPAFVILGTAFRVVRTLVHREDIVEEHVRRLEKRQRRELEGRRDGAHPDHPES